ncbi:protein MIZU-KUSSEI 1-like [Salvia hispanica]|uniref:protein MIZU-KUSSEI 1-like n=1 Tax=Salvia hispanica TaxID=49212 RepID=UPI002009A9DE|nr:protein MIZU-KUSSEI 1-like [Salvia hispanica]
MATCGVTSVDCEKQVRSWRLLRSMAELLLPTCNCIITQENEPHSHPPQIKQFRHKRASSASGPTTVSGTLYGHRRSKVTLCIQSSPISTSPILLLELAIPTNVLAKEMKGGSIRFAFESGAGAGPLLSMPAWTMYCNGRKLGFAVKRKPSRADVELLEKMQNVVVGAGLADDDVMYLRGKFERYHGSSNSDSFHLVDPDAARNGQELSFYFLRSC